jgi:hypothetical protein
MRAENPSASIRADAELMDGSMTLPTAKAKIPRGSSRIRLE